MYWKRETVLHWNLDLLKYDLGAPRDISVFYIATLPSRSMGMIGMMLLGMTGVRSMKHLTGWGSRCEKDC